MTEFKRAPWGLHPDALAIVADALAGRTPLAQLQARAEAFAALDRDPYTSGQVAILPLRGMITPRGSFLSLLFGGSGGLQGFREQLRAAVADSTVESIVIDVDSPGGLARLVPETAAEIRAAREVKQITAIANTTAASAAYWLASQADELVVTPSGDVGSIGVFILHEDISAMEEQIGIKTTLISAGKYKTEGNPYEPLGREAKQAFQQEVDEIYGAFIADVAEGRGASAQSVKSGFGEGRMALASQAVDLGMADRVESFEQTLARLGAAEDDEPEATPEDVEHQDLEDEVDDEATQTSPTPLGGGDEEERARVAELLLP